MGFLSTWFNRKSCQFHCAHWTLPGHSAVQRSKINCVLMEGREEKDEKKVQEFFSRVFLSSHGPCARTIMGLTQHCNTAVFGLFWCKRRCVSRACHSLSLCSIITARDAPPLAAAFCSLIHSVNAVRLTNAVYHFSLHFIRSLTNINSLEFSSSYLTISISLYNNKSQECPITSLEVCRVFSHPSQTRTRFHMT